MIDPATSPLKLQSQAIEAALDSRWEEALELNQKLNELEPENADCLNRLARTHFELGNYSQAKKLYESVLEIDPYNTIAQKNLKKVAAFKKDGKAPSNGNGHMIISPSFFLEEPGLTKTVTLIKVAEPQRLLILCSGQLVNLIPKNRGISVSDFNNIYLGVFPDDTAHHLLRLIEGGNKYQAFIRSIKSNSVTLLVREVFRSKKFKNQASFIEDSRVVRYSSDHITLFNDEASDDSGEEDPTAAKDENLDFKI